MPQSFAGQILLSQAHAERQGGRGGLHGGAALTHAISVLQCRMHGWQTTRVWQAVLWEVQGAMLLACVSMVQVARVIPSA